MVRVAVFGGSFNPPHVGHGLVAAWLYWSGRVDEVWLLPAHHHPFAKALAPFDARVPMCDALARAVGPWVRTCAIEAELPSPSYSIQTLDALASRHPSHRFQLVIGADVVSDLPRWHRWPDIEARYAPIRVGRQGYPTPEGAIDFPGISSTEVRQRLAAGASVDHLVPSTVRACLGTHYTAPLH